MISQRQLCKRVFYDPHYFLAFGFGSGLAGFAPGTWGTMMAIPLYLLLVKLPFGAYLGACVLAFIYGCWVCDKVAKELEVHDYKGIVWDEVLGYWLTMFMIPVSFKAVVLGFVLFRIFDIIKPPPIRWVDRHISGGFGIMFDDVLAAVPAWLVLFMCYKAGVL